MKKLKLAKMACNERLKFLRLEKGLTQIAMAKKMNKSRGWIAMLEFREKNMSVRNAFLLADFFKISLDFLLRGKK